METHHWYCRFFDQVRVKKGLPLVDERTGQQFFCPKIFSSFHSFRTHAFKCHAKDIAGGAGLAFKHVIGPGHGAVARNAVPVLRDASDQEQLEHQDLDLAKGQDSRAAGSSTGKSAQLETDEMIDKELARLMTLQANTDSDSESDFESERDVFKNCQRDYYRGPSCAAESQANLLFSAL